MLQASNANHVARSRSHSRREHNSPRHWDNTSHCWRRWMLWLRSSSCTSHFQHEESMRLQEGYLKDENSTWSLCLVKESIRRVVVMTAMNGIQSHNKANFPSTKSALSSAPSSFLSKKFHIEWYSRICCKKRHPPLYIGFFWLNSCWPHDVGENDCPRNQRQERQDPRERERTKDSPNDR